MLKVTNEFINSEEFKDGLDTVNECLKSLNRDSDIYLCKHQAKHRIKMLHRNSCVAEEIIGSFGDTESGKTGDQVFHYYI